MCFLSRSRAFDRFRSRPQKHEGGGSPRNRRATPVESIQLPATSIPHGDGHRDGHVLEEAKALHDIFHTPTSIEAYKAARSIPGFDPSSKQFISDADVKRPSPARSANSKLGALRHAVKQRLSESKLSQENSKKIRKRKHSVDSLGARGLVCTSFTSTGLTDLLMSRTASEGGYDSDAKDIPSLRLRKSTDHDSFRISPEYLSQALQSQVEPSLENANIASSTGEHPPDPVAIAGRSQEVDSFHETTPGKRGLQEAMVPEDAKGNGNGMAREEEARKMVSSTSQSLSEDCSIHLGDMPISQRLASTSAMPMSSIGSTTFGFVTKDDDREEFSPEKAQLSGFDQHKIFIDNGPPLFLHEQHSSAGRYASFIAHEHNRKPSDPGTKRLFEETADASKLYPKWKSINRSKSMLGGVKRRCPTRDDASSHSIGEKEIPDSGTGSLMHLVHSETIKNADCLAIRSRRASACSRQRNRSIGQSSNSEEGAWFAESRQREKHSPRDFEDILALHETVVQSVPMSSENGRTASERRSTEEPSHRHSRELQRLLTSAKANEGMDEITDGMLREERHKRVSEAAPDEQAVGARPCTGSHDSRSTSEGWPTQGGQCGFGSNLIKRSSSLDSRTSYEKSTAKHPRNNWAALGCDGAFKNAREDSSIESSSKSMPSLLCLNNLTGKEILGTSVNGQQTNDLTGPRSITSERRATAGELMGWQLDPLGTPQRTIVAPQEHLAPLSVRLSVKAGKDQSSQATSMKERPGKKSLFDIRRYMIADLNDESSLPPATYRDDFPSWCKFPSDHREENNGSAGDKDGVNVRDFCPPNSGTEDSELSSQVAAIQTNRSAASHGANFPGSWPKRALGHMKRKSKSMTLSWRSASPKPKATHKGVFWQMRDFYHSQSSDLRRFQGGHRSSVTLAREYKYPELDIPAGFGSSTLFTIPPTPFSRNSSRQAWISEGQGQDRVDLTENGEGKHWPTGVRPRTKLEIEACHPAGEAERVSTQNGMPKSSAPKGFDGTVSSRASKERVGDMTDPEHDRSWTARLCGNSTCSSFVSVTASDSVGDGCGDVGVKDGEVRLASPELRDSTVDFQKDLMEREQRSREDLLKLAQGLEGSGEGDRDMATTARYDRAGIWDGYTDA
jgi:hypothetical protein